MKKDFVGQLHLSTSRNYLERMINNKVECMKVARRFDKDFWDGERRYGYGGYNYIPGRWSAVADQIIKNYNLKKGSKILDVGCGKGYLLKELKSKINGLNICGFDISKYAIENSHPEVKEHLYVNKAQSEFKYKDNFFDLVISLGTLHNLELFDLKIAIKEIERVGKQKYIMVEAYRNEDELFNLQCWALTCKSFFSEDEWIWIYNEYGYTGDYEFIYF